MQIKTTTATAGPQTLSQRDIGRRIEDLVATLALGAGSESADARWRPRFISAAELVRRVQPYLSRN